MRATADPRDGRGRDCVLIVFAKAPDPGRVKSRLWPAIGPAGAARLQARLVQRAVATAVRAGCAHVVLSCAPRMNHPFFERTALAHGVARQAQGRGDLGARMATALARGLATHRYALLMGSDCPSLDVARLRRAAAALRDGRDAVFAPAEDGGYALVGLARRSTGLFRGVPWGTGEVMAATRARLRRLGWRWEELPVVWDVDRPEDLVRLRRSRLLERAA